MNAKVCSSNLLKLQSRLTKILVHLPLMYMSFYPRSTTTTSLSKIAMVMIPLALRPFFVDLRSHPLTLASPLLDQIFRDSLDIYIEVLSKELAHISVFMVSNQRARVIRATSIDIDINTRMAVCRPSHLGTATDDIGEDV